MGMVHYFYWVWCQLVPGVLRVFFQSIALQRCLPFDWFCLQCSPGSSTTSAQKDLQHLCHLVSTLRYMYLEAPTNHLNHQCHLLLWMPSLLLCYLWPLNGRLLLWLNSSTPSHYDCLSVFPWSRYLDNSYSIGHVFPELYQSYHTATLLGLHIY